ncbi:MAG: hypothetical protein AAGK14_00915 [Verrucomicrobiota bacterium]
MSRLLVAALLFALGFTTACTKRELRGDAPLKKEIALDEFRGDEYIARRGARELTVELEEPVTRAFAVFEVNHGARHGYDSELKLLDYIESQDVPADQLAPRKFPFILIPEESTRQAYEDLREQYRLARLPAEEWQQHRADLVAQANEEARNKEGEERQQALDRSKEIAQSRQPELPLTVRLHYRPARLIAYRENGIVADMPGGTAAVPWVVDRIVIP